MFYRVNNTQDLSATFHIYEMYWTLNGFKFYIDGKAIGKGNVTSPTGGFWKLGGFNGTNIWASGSKLAPFDKPVSSIHSHFFIISLY